MKNSSLVIACACIVSGSVHAQQVFNLGNLNATEARQGVALGTAMAPVTRYMVVTDWVPGVNASNWDAEFSITQQPFPAAPINVYRSIGRFRYGPQFADGSPQRLIDVGTFTIAPSAGSHLAFNYQQRFFGATASWNNTRVVLDPIINDNRTRAGLAVPTSFTNLGTLTVGQTSLNLNTGPASARVWYRFSVNADVTNVAQNAFDIFTAGTTGFDPRITLFRQTSSGLLPVADTDESHPGSRNAALSFGSGDATSNGRFTYPASAPSGFFVGQGGNVAAPTGYESGYYANTLGAASLRAGETYWLGVQYWGSQITSSLANESVSLGLDGISANFSGNYNLSWTEIPNNPVANMAISFRSIPSPGVLAIVVVGGVWSSRRRRS